MLAPFLAAPEMKDIAVAYLCRFGNPPGASRAFLESLLRFRAGAEFDLVYILKGFPDNETDSALSTMRAGLPWAVQEVRVSDEFFMINGLLDGAAQIPQRMFLPVGSWSRVLADDWLACFVRAFESVPRCVVAGATGSHDPWLTGGTHPNVHIRTTGFLIERKTFLGLDRGRLRTRLDNNYFEAGPNGMTQQLLAAGGQAVVVGRKQQCWLPKDWPLSRTFRSGQQENLLIADNQTQLYEGARFKKRRRMAKIAWNNESLASHPGIVRPVRRFFQEWPDNMKKIFHRWVQRLTPDQGKYRVADVRQAVIDAGFGCSPDGKPFFGYRPRPDGLYLQQDLKEYSEFVAYLANEHAGAKLAIDIGVASGGQTKFLRDYFPIEETIIVDLGQHHEFPHWQRIRPQVKSKIILEIIGDSHSQAVYERLQPYAGRIDFAFIDGDHSFVGLMRDIMLVQELCVPGALFVFHDTTAVPDCRKVFEKLVINPDFELLRNFDNRFGISVFRCLYPAPRQPFARHELAGVAWGTPP